MKFSGAARTQRCVIYAITCDASDKRYVGQTKATAVKRCYGHRCATLAGDNHPLYAAIRKHGFDAFTVDVIQVCGPEELDNWETAWIGALNTFYPNGYNLTTGGQRARRSKLARQRMKAGQKGVKRHFSADARRRMGRKGQPKPALAAVMRGRKLSVEHRAAIGRGLIGTHTGERSPEWRAAISAGMTEDGKQRTRAAHLGKKRSLETCKRIRESQRGKMLSLEHRAKLSESQRRAWIARHEKECK